MRRCRQRSALHRQWVTNWEGAESNESAALSGKPSTRPRVSASEFVAEADLLDQASQALDDAPATPQGPFGIEAETYLRELAETWADADEQARANLIHAIYDRIEVAGPDFIGVSLTPEAERHGLALALPEEVTIRSNAVLACPRGLEPPTFRSAT